MASSACVYTSLLLIIKEAFLLDYPSVELKWTTQHVKRITKALVTLPVFGVETQITVGFFTPEQNNHILVLVPFSGTLKHPILTCFGSFLALKL